MSPIIKKKTPLTFTYNLRVHPKFKSSPTIKKLTHNSYYIWIIGELLILLLNMKYGWIWMMGEYDLCVNMNYGWIWIMAECDLCVNMNYGWIWIMGGGDRQTSTQKHTQTDTHLNTMTRSGLGAGPSENIGVSNKTRRGRPRW